MPKGRPCVICGAEFSAVSKNTKTCSPSCRKEHMERNTEEKYATRVGEPIGPWLRRRYVDDRWAYRQLMEALGLTNVRVLMRMMHRHQVPIRDASEAVATKFVRNPSRRDLAREVFTRNNLAPKKGQPNPAQEPATRRKISRAKTGHEMYSRPEWKQRVCAHHQEREQNRPETDIEATMRQALEAEGIAFQQQLPVACYVIDFAITQGDRKVGVEVDGAYWHNLPKRVERDPIRDAELAEDGWTILRFPEADVKANVARCVAVIKAALAP